MGLKMEDLSFNIIKYRMLRMVIFCEGVGEGQLEIETGMISSIIIEKDYDNYLYPFFEIECTVPNYAYRAMKRQSQNIRTFIDLQSGLFTSQEGAAESWSSFLKGNYYVLLDETSPDLYEGLHQKEEEQNGSYDNGYDAKNMSTIKLLLYDEKKLFNSKKIVNAILSSTTLLDALVYTCNQAGLDSILMSPPGNNKAYSEFRITPIPAGEQIQRICNKYGIHNKGTVVFLDFDKFYITERVPECNAYMPNEIRVCYMMSMVNSTTDGSAAKGCFENGAEKYDVIYANPETISFTNLTSTNEQLFGNNAISIDTKTGSVNQIAGNSIEAMASGKTGVFVTNEGEPTAGALQQALKEAAYVGVIGFSYIDLSMLAPNKTFFLHIDDSKHAEFNGRYRITKYTCLMQKEGQLFCPHVTAEFRG